jgi:uncharacterized protein (UPF0248 family)
MRVRAIFISFLHLLSTTLSFHSYKKLPLLSQQSRVSSTDFPTSFNRRTHSTHCLLCNSDDATAVTGDIDPDDAALMAKITAQADDNVSMRWSLEDDKVLYESFQSGVSIEDLCVTLRRGFQGVKARLNHLNNPKHKAYMRYFRTEEKVLKTELESISLRPCKDCIERIIWDPALDINDFSFIYLDRFDGLFERPCVAPNVDVKGKERMLIKAIPEHRIQSLKYKERVVWDKADRLDLIFGSSPGLLYLSNPNPSPDPSPDPNSDLSDYINNEVNNTDSSDVSNEDSDEVKNDGDNDSNINDSIESNLKLSEIKSQLDQLNEVIELSEEEDSTTEVSNDNEISTHTDDSWLDSDDDGWEEETYFSYDDKEELDIPKKYMKIETVIATYESWLATRNKEDIKIFCDLDGVLVDFEGGVKKLFKVRVRIKG